MFFLFPHMYEHYLQPQHVFSISESSEPRTLKKNFYFFLFWTSFRYDALSHRRTNIPLCVGGGEGEKKGREVACSPGLSGSFCSCAIICGGALRAAMQHHTVLHTSMEKMATLEGLSTVTQSPVLILTHLMFRKCTPKKKKAARLFVFSSK